METTPPMVGCAARHPFPNLPPLPSLLPFLALFFALYLAGRGLDLFWWRPRRLERRFAAQGIRGPAYRFFFGNIKEMVALMARAAAAKPLAPPWASHDVLARALAFYPYWRKIYGPTFLLWFGPTPRLVVSEPETIREILVTNADVYDKYESHPLIRQLEGNGLLSLNGAKWAHHRRIIAPTFHTGNLKSLVPFVAGKMEGMADKWEEKKQQKQGGGGGGGMGEVEVDVFEWFQGVAGEAIAQATFGPSSDVGGQAVFRMQARQMELAAEAFRTVFIPGYRFLPTGKNRDSWRLEREINASLVGIIESRKGWGTTRGGEGVVDKDDDHDMVVSSKTQNKSQTQPQPQPPVDLLGRLLVSDYKSYNDTTTTTTATIQGAAKPQQEAAAAAATTSTSPPSSSSPTLPPLSVHDIVQECKTFFFAGKHTTSNLLTWATVMLAMHPEWQDKARDEVRRVCGNGHITAEHVAQLKTLAMVVNETLRLYPPVVAAIRKAKTDVILSNATSSSSSSPVLVPRGTELLIPILAVHSNPAFWGADAAQFNPARFAAPPQAGNSAGPARRHMAAFIPFGLGGRTCVGKNLAIMEAKVALAVLLRRFQFRMSPKYVHAPTVLMLLYPQYGAPVVFKPLEQGRAARRVC